MIVDSYVEHSKYLKYVDDELMFKVLKKAILKEDDDQPAGIYLGHGRLRIRGSYEVIKYEYDRNEPVTLKWTKDRPTEEGFYLYTQTYGGRGFDIFTCHVKAVDKTNKRFRFHASNGWSGPLSELDGTYWFGPIPEPEEG